VFHFEGGHTQFKGVMAVGKRSAVVGWILAEIIPVVSVYKTGNDQGFFFFFDGLGSRCFLGKKRA
jgi:hypothetical protein